VSPPAAPAEVLLEAENLQVTAISAGDSHSLRSDLKLSGGRGDNFAANGVNDFIEYRLSVDNNVYSSVYGSVTGGVYGESLYGSILYGDASGDNVQDGNGVYTDGVTGSVYGNGVSGGVYNVKIRVMKSDDRGIYRLSVNGVDVSQAVDNYALPSSNVYQEIDLGTVSLTSPGDQLFRFTCTGKNGSSKGYRLVLDYIKLTRQ
jgi:hypothetical protein